MSMNDETPLNNRQRDESDIGPEPEWLDEPVAAAAESQSHEAEDTLTVDITPEKITSQPISPIAKNDLWAERLHPWLRALVPFVLLLVTGVIVWIGTSQSLNGVTTWEAMRIQQVSLLPARWAMMMWWVILGLLGIFLLYAALPRGRVVTHFRTTGPIIELALISLSFWLITQHWQWHLAGLIAISIAVVAMLASYLILIFDRSLTGAAKRLLVVSPLSATLAFSGLLAILSVQETLGLTMRISGILALLLVIILAAVCAFFLRDGIVPLVVAIWTAGVVQQQWNDDALISIVAVVATIIAALLTVMGLVLAMESQRPSFTTNLASRRGRTSFFRKNRNTPPEALP